MPQILKGRNKHLLSGSFWGMFPIPQREGAQEARRPGVLERGVTALPGWRATGQGGVGVIRSGEIREDLADLRGGAGGRCGVDAP